MDWVHLQHRLLQLNQRRATQGEDLCRVAVACQSQPWGRGGEMKHTQTLRELWLHPEYSSFGGSPKKKKLFVVVVAELAAVVVVAIVAVSVVVEVVVALACTTHKRTRRGRLGATREFSRSSLSSTRGTARTFVLIVHDKRTLNWVRGRVVRVCARCACVYSIISTL